MNDMLSTSVAPLSVAPSSQLRLRHADFHSMTQWSLESFMGNILRGYTYSRETQGIAIDLPQKQWFEVNID